MSESIQALRAELEELKPQLRDAIESCDEGRLAELRARQDVLPVRILNAQIEGAQVDLEQAEQELTAAREEHAAVFSDYQGAIKHAELLEAELQTARQQIQQIRERCRIRQARVYQAEATVKSAQRIIGGLEQDRENHINATAGGG